MTYEPENSRDRDGRSVQGPSQEHPLANPLLRLLLRNVIIGSVAAVVVVAGLLATDAAGLRTLITSASDPILPIVLLIFGFVITLGSCAMGAAIMALPYETSDGEDGGGEKRVIRVVRHRPGATLGQGEAVRVPAIPRRPRR